MVAEFCSGEVDGVKPPEVDAPYDPTLDETQPSLVVHPDNLPAERPSVWTAYNIEGWHLGEDEADDYPELSIDAVCERRDHAKSLLARIALAQGGTFAASGPLTPDWSTSPGDRQVMGDDFPYRVAFSVDTDDVGRSRSRADCRASGLAGRQVAGGPASSRAMTAASCFSRAKKASPRASRHRMRTTGAILLRRAAVAARAPRLLDSSEGPDFCFQTRGAHGLLPGPGSQLDHEAGGAGIGPDRQHLVGQLWAELVLEVERLLG